MSKQKDKKMDPDAALALIVKNNNKYVKTHNPEYFLGYETEQKPNVVYLGCMDSRVHLIAFVEDPNNKIMVVRNMGNQLKTAEGSIDYAIHGQNTPLLLIVGHPYCGALENIFYDYMNNSGFTKPMKKELKQLEEGIIDYEPRTNFERYLLGDIKGESKLNEYQQILREMKETDQLIPKEEFEKKLLGFTLANVNVQTDAAIDKYHSLIKKGKLKVVGGYYDFRNELKQGYGKIVVYNINGHVAQI